MAIILPTTDETDKLTHDELLTFLSKLCNTIDFGGMVKSWKNSKLNSYYAEVRGIDTCSDGSLETGVSITFDFTLNERQYNE